jgi:hypothetical protein
VKEVILPNEIVEQISKERENFWGEFDRINKELEKELPPPKWIADMQVFWDYGRAVDWCITYNIPLLKIELISSNPKIEKIARKRATTTPDGKRRIAGMLLEPFELDYFCPICGDHPEIHLKEDNEIELLHLEFSEYNYFMFCKRCNLDIPSYLCLRARNKVEVKSYTDHYLEMIYELKENKEFEIIQSILIFLENHTQTELINNLERRVNKIKKNQWKKIV